MRSKEVSEAIDLLENGIADYVIGFYCIDEEDGKKLCNNYCEKCNEGCIYNQAIDKVIEYIEELEQENKKISDELIEEKQLNVKYLKIREEKENIIKKISLEAQKYFDMLMEVEYGRDTFPKQMIRDKIKELEECIKHLGNDGIELTWKESAEAQVEVLKSMIGE